MHGPCSRPGQVCPGREHGTFFYIMNLQIIFIMSLMSLSLSDLSIAVMPHNYKPKNILTTDRTNLEKAFNYRLETNCSIRTVCNLFGVKPSTLGVSLNKSKPSYILMYMGRPQLKKLTFYIYAQAKNLTNWGHSVTKHLKN